MGGSRSRARSEEVGDKDGASDDGPTPPTRRQLEEADSNPSSGFGVIVLLSSHSTYCGTEVWAGATVSSSRMHDAVAESRTEPHREPTMKTLVDDAKILTTCTQHNTNTTPQHHNNTTTPQQHHNTPASTHVSKALHHHPPLRREPLGLVIVPRCPEAS